jgi:hypothetical protein
MYMIDTKTGEDKCPPTMVGEKISLDIVSDGVILIGPGNKDNVMKTDYEGKIIWKSSIDFEVKACDLFQIVNGNVVASLWNGDIDGSGSYTGTSIFAVVNIETGEIELTFTDTVEVEYGD